MSLCVVTMFIITLPNTHANTISLQLSLNIHNIFSYDAYVSKRLRYLLSRVSFGLIFSHIYLMLVDDSFIIVIQILFYKFIERKDISILRCLTFLVANMFREYHGSTYLQLRTKSVFISISSIYQLLGHISHRKLTYKTKHKLYGLHN